MKKFRNVLTGVLSALVLGGGVFLTSCSDGGDSSNSSSFTSTTKEIDNTADVLGKVTDSLSSSDANKATAAYNADKSKIVITSKAAGEATITAKETADATDSATIKVVVASDGKITATVTKKIGENPTPAGGETVTYAFDDLTSVPDTVEGDNSILDGKVIYWVGAGKTGNAKVTANSDATHHYLQVSAGGAIAADATTVDIANQTTYLKVKAPKAGKEKITFTFTTVKGGSDSQNRILIVDPADGKILGQTAEVACGTTDDNTEKTLSVEATVPETFLVVFARSNGKGGFKFTKFEQVNTDGPAKTLTSIAVKTAPSKQYAKTSEATETVADLTGLVITLTYSDNSTEDVAYSTENASEFTATKINQLNPGEQDVTVTYKEKTATFKATVLNKTLTGYELSGTLTKTEYKYNEEFDPAGLSVVPAYGDGSKGDAVALTATNCTSTYSKTTIGAQTVTITYDGKALTPTQNVTVNNYKTGIEATMAEGKGTYTEGDAVATGDVVVKFVWADGTKTDAAVTTDYTYSPSTVAAGDTKITVTATDTTLATKTADVTITVNEMQFANTATINLATPSDATAAAWFPWSGIPAGANTDNVVVNGTTVSGYLQQKVSMTSEAKVCFRKDKAALFVDRASEEATVSSANVIKALGIPGKFKITVYYKPTNKTSTNRGMKIFRSAGESDLWTGEAKVSKTYAANQDESSISYLYTGDDASSAAGIQIYDSTGGTSMAVYLTKIEIKTNTAIPADTFPATSVTVKDSAGNVIANNGALTITKNDSNYQLTATKEPAWSTDNITWTSSNAAVTVTDGKLTFGEITSDTTANITATAGNVSSTVALTISATVSDAQKVAKTKEEVQAIVNAFTYTDVTKTYLASLQAALTAGTYTYTNEGVTLNAAAFGTETGDTLNVNITFSAGSVNDKVAVAYPTQTVVTAMVNALKAKNVTWTTNAATTKTAVDTAVAAIAASSDVTVAVVPGETVTATVTSTIDTGATLTGNVITWNPPPITVEGGVATLVAASYEYPLSQANIYTEATKQAWSTAATNNWSDKTGTIVFKEQISAYNMSKTDRTITLKVKNVAQIDLYVYNNTADRTFTTKVGEAAAVTQTHGGAGDEKFVIKTNTADEVTVVIAGAGSSVYPLGVVLKKTADSE